MIDETSPCKPTLVKVEQAARPGTQELVLGDHVEIAKKIIETLQQESGVEESPVFARGKLRGYQPETGLWVEVEKHELIRMISSFSGTVIPKGNKVSTLKLKYADISGIMKVLFGLRSRPGFFEDVPNGVAFTNGFLRLDPREGKSLAVLHEHAPEHRATFMLPFDYDPGAPATRWEMFLHEIFTHPSELIPAAQGGATEADRAAFELDRTRRIAMLEEWLGACLVGVVVKYHTCLVLNGEGSNGKSVFLEVIRRLFPPESVRSIKPQKWSEKFSVADLENCPINIVNEMPDAEMAGGDTFKAVIAGDPIQAERKYQDPFTLKPRAGHIFACNRLPGTMDQSTGFWRRWLIAMFDRTFDDRSKDVDLTSKLTTPEALKGIAARVINAVITLESRGKFIVPASSEDAKSEWKMDSDQVMQFVSECCDGCHTVHTFDCGSEDDLCPETKCRVHSICGPEIYPLYREWSRACGHKTLARNNFLSRLKQLGHARRNKIEKWYALRIKDDARNRYSVASKTDAYDMPPLKKKEPAFQC